MSRIKPGGMQFRIIEICWHCSGTGQRMVRMTSRPVFGRCSTCYGAGGRLAAPYQFLPHQQCENEKSALHTSRQED